jgi:hypothetical protein
MNTAFDVLVIILSCLLGIYLILSIIVIILIWRLVIALRAIVAKGEHIVDSAEAISETLRKNAGGVAIARLLMHFISGMSGDKGKRRKD